MKKIVTVMAMIACLGTLLTGCGSSVEDLVGTGLWLSDSKDNDGYNYGMYFVAEEDLLLMGWVDRKQDGEYFIKGNPYSFHVDSGGISVEAGYDYGSEIADDEMGDGMPELKFDGDNIICIGSEYDGMLFSYASDTCRYVIDN